MRLTQGRLFTDAENHQGAAAVAVIAESMARTDSGRRGSRRKVLLQVRSGQSVHRSCRRRCRCTAVSVDQPTRQWASAYYVPIEQGTDSTNRALLARTVGDPPLSCRLCGGVTGRGAGPAVSRRARLRRHAPDVAAAVAPGIPLWCSWRLVRSRSSLPRSDWRRLPHTASRGAPARSGFGRRSAPDHPISSVSCSREAVRRCGWPRDRDRACVGERTCPARAVVRRGAKQPVRVRHRGGCHASRWKPGGVAACPARGAHRSRRGVADGIASISERRNSCAPAASRRPD